MQDFDQRLEELFSPGSELATLKDLANQGQPLWLVGGTLRDLLRGAREVSDIDFCSPGDPTELAQSWSRRVSGRWFWLDQERKQSRVLLPNRMTVDFTPLRAPSIEEDLASRDYTVNAMALSLASEISFENLIDPLNGHVHLQTRTLVLCSPLSIPDDPLRMLKGIRHAVTLGFDLADSAVAEISSQADMLKNVAAERIRDELGMILSSGDPVYGFELMQKTGLLACLFGPPAVNWSASECFAQLAGQISKMKDPERQSQEQEVRELYNSRSLFLLTAFLSSYAPENLEALLHDRLRLSRQQQRLICSLLRPPGSKWLDQARVVSTPRQKALLVEQLGYFPDEQLLYFSVCRELLPLELARDLLTAFYEYQRLGRIPDLLSGHQLKTLLHGQPEAEIGRWLRKIKGAEITGEISGEEDVFSWCKEKLSN